MDDKKIISSTLFSVHPERWCIQDNEQKYWNGKKFVPDKSKAVLYDTIDRANGDVHQILIKAYTGKRTGQSQFILPILINTYGDPNIPDEDVLGYLMKALNLTIDQDTHGNGPNGNLVLPSVSWKGFKKEEKNE